MRPQAPLRLTVLAASAALTLGWAGPAAADAHKPPHASTVAAQAPLGRTAALPAGLGDLGKAVSAAVAELIASIKADGRLTTAASEAFDAKIAQAVEAAKADAMAPLPTTAVPDLPVPDTPAVAPPKAEAPAAATVVARPVAAEAAPADLLGDAGATVQKAVADLVDLIVSTLLGGLTAIDLPALPALPDVPALPTPPALPTLPTLPSPSR
ncbi:hypothetical protein AMK29_07450 [Streptomyces sp. CB02261]|nr:hypothetical protein AMK29_07450 [Streptomyces sp. CB02261]